MSYLPEDQPRRFVEALERLQRWDPDAIDIVVGGSSPELIALTVVPRTSDPCGLQAAMWLFRQHGAVELHFYPPDDRWPDQQVEIPLMCNKNLENLGLGSTERD